MSIKEILPNGIDRKGPDSRVADVITDADPDFVRKRINRDAYGQPIHSERIVPKTIPNDS